MTVLPLSSAEFSEKRFPGVDIVLVTGDAYVDHPSFGIAVIGRVLRNAGYRVGIIAMPDWRDADSITIFGRPRLFFGVTAGNVDSMLSRFTAFKKVRNDDPYAPDGRAGHRPERATIVYCNLIKARYRELPIIIGGVEASMRRLAHYDFWSNTVRRSILLDSRADALVYGMGESAVLAIADRIANGRDLAGIPGTVTVQRTPVPDAVMLPDEENVITDTQHFLSMYRTLYRNQHTVIAQSSGKRYLVQQPPLPMAPEELAHIYALPFTRLPHPRYGNNKIPAFEMVQFSINAHRGCVSGCSFCGLGLHQGRRIIPRPMDSVLDEAARIASATSGKVHISDIGGPSANMYGFQCKAGWRCNRESCIHPDQCTNLIMQTNPWIDLLDRALQVKGVGLVTVGSGIRYDLLMREDPALLKPLVARHISGRLKIAPEHTSPAVLRAMRKNPHAELRHFIETFDSQSRSMGKKYYVVPYLMSCHPGCGMKEMSRMRQEIASLFSFMPEQVQAFIPLPMTLSSVIYHTGTDPITGEEFFVERNAAGRRRQHDLFFN